MSSPLISVLLPFRNAEAYLQQAIESVVSQSMTDWELVLVDDGSSDASASIAQQAKDARIRVVRGPGDGLVAALNEGLRHCRGELVARLDADDICLPCRLRAQADYFSANPETVLLGGHVTLIDAGGSTIGRWRLPCADRAIRRGLGKRTCFVHSTVMFKRTVVERVGGYRSSFPHAEDLDLWLRLAPLGPLANLRDVVVRYRIHGHQLSGNNIESQALSALAALACAEHRLSVNEKGEPAEALTRAYLERELSKACVAEALTGGCLSWAELFAAAGCETQSRALLDMAGTHADTGIARCKVGVVRERIQLRNALAHGRYGDAVKRWMKLGWKAACYALARIRSS